VTAQAGTALHTTRVGDPGQRVAFLHGLFGQGRNFRGIARSLEPEFTSLLVDLPDHGRSPWTDRFDFEGYAEAVAAELGQFGGGEPVHLVGHSLGGKVAMAVALHHPGLVDRLVVVDISPVGTGETGEFEDLLGALAALDLQRLERRTDADEALAGPIPNRTVRGFLLQNLREQDGTWRWQANLDLLRRALPQIGGFLQYDGAPFEGPVLWVAGERSDYVRPEDGDAMRALFPRTRQVTIKAAGHWVHSEQPEAFASTLRAFLSAG
jgi:pimeloyl-ACP methyl ester carboxylesterase